MPAGDAALIEPVCQASLLWSEHGSREPILAFSNPASQTSRSRMTVRLSDDGGRSWARQTVVHEGPSAYSNLVTLPNGNLAILFEGGASSPCEGIAFREPPFGRFEAVTASKQQPRIPRNAAAVGGRGSRQAGNAHRTEPPG